MTRFKRRQEWATYVRNREFFEVKLRGLFQICKRVLDRGALTHSPYLRTRGNVEVIFPVNNRRESLHSHEPAPISRAAEKTGTNPDVKVKLGSSATP